MLGFRLLGSALWGFFRKFPQALGVSIVPAFMLYVWFTYIADLSDRILNIEYAFWAIFLGFFAVTVPLLAWASLNWHRVAILGEFPAFFPRFTAWAWLRFTLRLAVLTTGVVGFYFVFFFLVDVVFTQAYRSSMGEIITVLAALGVALVAYLSTTLVTLRLLPSLSSIALDESLTFRESWRQTRPYTAALIIISLSMLVITIGVVVISFAFPVFRLNVWPFISWLITAMHVAVVAEFYGYVWAQNDVTQVFE